MPVAGSFFEIVFVMDVSGSMGGTASLREEAVNLVLNEMVDGVDRAAGVNFTDASWVLHPLSSDLESVRSAMRYASGGGTNITNGLSEAIKQFRYEGQAGARRAIILLTDGHGGLNCSWAQNNIQNDVAVYTVGFGSADAGGLECLADTGDGTGQFFWAEDFVSIFAQIIDDILDQRQVMFGKNGLIYILVNYILDAEQNEYVEAGEKVYTRESVDNASWRNEVDPGKSSLKIKRGEEGEEKVLHQDSGSHEYNVGESRLYVISDSAEEGKALDNQPIYWNLNCQDTADEARWDVSFGATVSSNHYHRQLPGIIEEFEGIGKLFAQNISVEVNGVPVTDFSGSTGGEGFEAVYDATDDLEPGQMNTITISSDELGHLMAFVEGDVYRTIIGDG